MPHLCARLALALAMAIGLVATMTSPGHAQFVVYDKFPGPLINPEKWFGAAGGDWNVNSPVTERIRVIENGQLRLGVTSYGNLFDNSGNSSAGDQLNISQLGTPGGSGSITGLSARVTVLDAEYQSCAANSSFKTVWAQIGGFFFNDGNGALGDQTGNVNANMFMQLHPNGADRKISYAAFRCLSPNCNNGEGLPGSGASFTTTWDFNTPVVMKVVWQPANKQFLFSVNGTEVKTLTYTFPDTAAPTGNGDVKFLSVQNIIHNCTDGRKRGTIDALFEKVMVKRKP